MSKLFYNLFEGGDHGFGLIDKNSPTGYVFRHSIPTYETYLAHLKGKISLGIVPINRSGKTKFGCIDFDDHHKKPTGYKFNYDKLLKKIKFLKLPLTVF